MPELYQNYYHIISTDEKGKIRETLIDISDIVNMDNILSFLIEIDPPKRIVDAVLSEFN